MGTGREKERNPRKLGKRRGAARRGDAGVLLLPKEGSDRAGDGCSRDFLRIPRRLSSTVEDNRETTFNRFHEIVLGEIRRTSGLDEAAPDTPIFGNELVSRFADRGQFDFTDRSADLSTSSDAVRVEKNVGECTLVKASPLKTNAFSGGGGTRSGGFSLGRECSSFREGAREDSTTPVRLVTTAINSSGGFRG